jgi:NAD(P)H-dependent FMN reductase
MKLGIVIGSVREGRVTDRLAKWVEREAKDIKGIEPKIIDLKDIPLPLFDEAASPQYNPNRQSKNEVKVWLDAVNGCDALALVTPEYNRSLSAALKNAIDYLDYQLKRKPVLLVAHGSTGGAQAVSHLRGILPGVLAVTVPPAVMIVGQVGSMFDAEGNMNDELKANPYGPQASLTNGLSELKWYSDILAAGRQ